ncbi:MAG: hypothetical protein ACKVUS_11560 [Saprospiraceae bacterium]
MITSESRQALISLRIEQAEQAVRRVESSLANDEPEIAANRIYYGMFYAMLALGLLRGFETFKAPTDARLVQQKLRSFRHFPQFIYRSGQKGLQGSFGCRLRSE